MAIDRPTDGGDRKTLDDIRRELAAEYPPFPTTRAPVDSGVPDSPAPDGSAAVEVQSAAPAVEVQPAAPRRTRARDGYIIAGVIGCLAGQFAVLGFSTVTRYWVAPGVASVGAPMAAPASQPVDAASPPVVAPAPVAPGPLPPSASTPLAQQASPALAPPPSSPLAPPPSDVVVTEPPAAPSVPPPAAPRSVAKDEIGSQTAPAPVARRPAKPRPAAPASGAVASVPRSEPRPSDKWMRSQEEVRAALNDWLSRSGHAAARAHVSETVVFLGADGQTARTHVPIRTGEGVVVREQRWRREPSGWRLVEEHDAWQAK